ncbi:unnamed protein product, partial [Polarella glacialis]
DCSKELPRTNAAGLLSYPFPGADELEEGKYVFAELDTSFAATLDFLGPDDLGMAFEKFDDDLLLVRSVKGSGAVARWNSFCPEGQKIACLDRIAAVNGVSGMPLDLLSMMHDELLKSAQVTIQRPVMKNIDIKRKEKGESLGIDLGLNP